MPDPKENENLETFLDRCIPMVMGDGSAEGNDQAVAMCHKMWTAAKKSVKAESLEEMQNDVWMAFDAQLRGKPMPMPAMDYDGWLVATYDDHIIACFGEAHFKIPFTREEGEIAFAPRNEWVEVEKPPDEWIEKVKAMKIARREDVSAAERERSMDEYGDVDYADEKNKKYPIDTEEHIRAAFNYINKPDNAAKYTADEVEAIKRKIVAAWKKMIDKEGPPSEAEKTIDLSDVLVAFGEPVKSLGGGRFGGYLVRFSTAEDPDITSDFFTPDTDYDIEFPGKSSHYYHHGLDLKFGKRKIGTVVLSKDDVGVWAEAIVKARDEYEEMLVKLAGEGKFGWSSGTATHLVERKPAGKATQITKWPLGLDASWTPTPAEPRNQVIPLKSLMGDIASNEETMDVETVETVTQEVKPLPAAKQNQLRAKAFIQDWL